MEYKISQWDKKFKENLTIEAICSYFPRDTYRVSSFSYPKEINFPAAMRSGICFVLKGQCRYCFKDLEINLKARDFANLPEGNYTLTVIGEEDLEIVLVWKLPK